MTDLLSSDDVGRRLRHTLQAVAGTVTEDDFADPTMPTVTKRPHRGRRIALGVGAVAIPLVLAAFAFVREGPEYVDTIPPSAIVMSGSVDGRRYLLMESDRDDECGQRVTGVELVEEDKNLLGSEWNTTGHEYGEPRDTACGYVNDTSRYLKNPALFNDSGQMVGDSFVWVYDVHPDVTAVRITAGNYTKDLKAYEVDGAGYAVFEVPKNLDKYTSELLIDDQVVPGSMEIQKLRRP